MKALALLALLLWQADPPVKPEPQHLQYTRSVDVTAGPATAACAVLDGPVYAHSASLKDMRLYAAAAEVPYALSTSQTALSSDPAKVVNLGTQGKEASGSIHLSFDLEMPARPYTDVDLDLAFTNFLGTATVTGRNALNDRDGKFLGSFTLFDLSAQHLSRNTTLALGESTFPFLHVDLPITAAPGAQLAFVSYMVHDASVPPSRQAQTLYTTLLATNTITQRGRQSIATFTLPAGVPVERVSFDLQPGDKTNFSREVHITATEQAGSQQPNSSEQIDGSISRVQLTQLGREVRSSELSIPATLGINQQAPATVEVSVDNGDDRPIALQSVRLEMRERKVCFDVPASPITMFYGDPKLTAPIYDYARIFNPAAPIRLATLTPEQPNPTYAAREEHRSLTEKHPELIWLALLAVVAALGLVAFRSAKKV